MSFMPLVVLALGLLFATLQYPDKMKRAWKWLAVERCYLPMWCSHPCPQARPWTSRSKTHLIGLMASPMIGSLRASRGKITQAAGNK